MELCWKMHITSTVFIFYLSLFHASLLLTQSFTVQYLNEANGSDTSECDLPNQACKTLTRVLSSNVSNFSLSIWVWPGKYVYETQTTISILHLRNLRIQKMPGCDGEVIFQCSSYNETAYNGLEIYYAENVTISGITFEQCGPQSSGLYVVNTTEIQISECTFRNNSGGGVFIRNVLRAQIAHCIFTNNVGSKPISIIDPTFIDRALTFGGLSILLENTSSAAITVLNCNLSDNAASENELNSNDPRPQGYTPFGHGGAVAIVITDSSKHTKVKVTQCVFARNSAKYAGGSIYIPIFQHSRNNSVIISNSTFWESMANASGGAISIDIFDVGENNIVEIEDTEFFGGSAFGGGAISVILQDSLASLTRTDTSHLTVAVLRRCRFEGNYSPTGGSAVGLVSNARVDQLSFTVMVTDCIFMGNQAINQSSLFTFRLPIVFTGTNKFHNNSGGAIYILQTSLDAKGTLLFENNTATRGGAVTFEDFSVINLHSGTNVVFEGNRADTVGGAILVENPSLIQDITPLFNALCFFQYETETEDAKSLPPSQWENVSVTFTSNTAGHAGAAIYAADIRVCTFNCVECKPRNNITQYQQSIFSEKPPFYFRDNQVLGEKPVQDDFVNEVATEPSTLQVVPERWVAAPGELLNLKILAQDQSGNQREAIWSFDDDSVSTTGFHYFSIGDIPKNHSMTFEVPTINQEYCEDQVAGDTLTGHQEDLEFFIIQTLTGEVSYETHVPINVTCCHPGYYYSETNHGGGTCVFISNYSHLLRPEQDNRYFYLEPGYYAGFYKDTSLNKTSFTIALFSSIFQNCTKEGTRTGCLYKYDKPDEQCVDNRTGYMCGQCPVGEGVDLTLRKCKKCTTWDAVGLVVICLLVVLISALILAFNIGLPNDMLGFLFFAQVVGYVYQSGTRSATWDYHLSRLLGFSVYLPICPFTTLPALWTTAFGFLPSVLATTTVILYVICARYIRRLSQHTAFSGIWLIFLFVYKFTADTISNILKCVSVKEVTTGHSLDLVFYYDGNVQCFNGGHLVIAIPSLFLFVLVVFIVPVSIIVISFRRFKTTQAFTDVITDGVVRRWWKGFDVIRRLMYIVIGTVFDMAFPEYTQLILVFTTMVVLGVLCAAKPYKRHLTNYIEAIILLDLLLIAIYFLNEQEFRKVSTPYFALILLLLPFIYAIGNISIKIGVMLWKKYIPFDANMLKDYITFRNLKRLPQRKRKPLLKQTFTDLQTLNKVAAEEEESFAEVDYLHFREELLDSYS